MEHSIQIENNQAKISGLEFGKIHFLFGRNGIGKSRILRELDLLGKSGSESGVVTTYIAPERGGEHSMWNQVGAYDDNPDALADTLRQNQVPKFRQISYSHFDELRNVVRKKREECGEGCKTFKEVIENINLFLDNVELKENDKSGFIVVKKGDTNPENDIKKHLSSGEKEMISLMIEISLFVETLSESKSNYLLLDEPDVHLHPDAESRLMMYLSNQLANIPAGVKAVVVAATHSTDLFAKLSIEKYKILYLDSISRRDFAFEFVNNKKSGFLLSIGSHPLLLTLEKRPILLVEGEDDRRLWDSVIRGLEGKLSLWCVPCGDKDSVLENVKTLNQINGALEGGDKLMSFALVDRDSDEQKPDDLERVAVDVTECRMIENLLLSDEVLGERKSEILRRFQITDEHRKSVNIKGREQQISNALGWKHEWETLIGSVLEEKIGEAQQLLQNKNSIFSYLGDSFTTRVLLNNFIAD